MSKPPYRGLSFGLRLVSALIAVLGMFAIFSSKPLVMQLFMHPPASGLQPAARDTEESGRGDAHGQRDAVFRRPRPGAQRRHHRRIHFGSLRSQPCGVAFRKFARRLLSSVFGLGDRPGSASGGGGAVLRAPAGNRGAAIARAIYRWTIMPNVSQRSLAEGRYLDRDGTLLSIVINTDTNGKLFEPDFWKVDFSPLKRYPRPSDLSAISPTPLPPDTPRTRP